MKTKRAQSAKTSSSARARVAVIPSTQIDTPASTTLICTLGSRPTSKRLTLKSSYRPSSLSVYSKSKTVRIAILSVIALLTWLDWNLVQRSLSAYRATPSPAEGSQSFRYSKRSLCGVDAAPVPLPQIVIQNNKVNDNSGGTVQKRMIGEANILHAPQVPMIPPHYDSKGNQAQNSRLKTKKVGTSNSGYDTESKRLSTKRTSVGGKNKISYKSKSNEPMAAAMKAQSPKTTPETDRSVEDMKMKKRAIRLSKLMGKHQSFVGHLNKTRNARLFRYVNVFGSGGIPRSFDGDILELFQDRLDEVAALRTSNADSDGKTGGIELREFDGDDDGYSGENYLPYIKAPSRIVLVARSSDNSDTQNEDNDSGRVDITLATQTSINRLYQIPELMRRWQGSLSIAVYVESLDQLSTLSKTLDELKAELKAQHRKSILNHGEESIVNGRRVIISLLFGVEFLDIDISAGGMDYFTGSSHSQVPVYRTHPFDANVHHHPYDLLFPINALRNLAVSQCRTGLVLSVDADFVPSYGALDSFNSPSILDAVNAHLNDKSIPRSVLVVPAFELLHSVTNRTNVTTTAAPSGASIHTKNSSFTESILPEKLNLEYLRSACSTAKIIPFHSKLDWLKAEPDHKTLKSWCTGASPSPGAFLHLTKVQSLTNFTTYLSKSLSGTLYTLPTQPIIDTLFEPYYLAHKRHFPTFKGIFRGYGFNKRAHSIECQRRGFQFLVEAGGAFLVHRQHAGSASKKDLKENALVRRTVGRAFIKFMDEVKRHKFYQTRAERKTELAGTAADAKIGPE